MLSLVFLTNMFKNSHRLPTVTVQPVIFDVLRGGNISRLPLSRAYVLEEGMLICFQTYDESQVIDDSQFLYATVTEISLWNDAPTKHDRENHYMVKFRVTRSIADICIL